MKIQRLKVLNYRTLEDVEIHFSSYYCAICGKNNSGKTNVIRALRLFFRDLTPYYMFPFEEKPRISIKEDYPAWALKDGTTKSVLVEVEAQIFKASDGGLYQFLVDYLDIQGTPEALELQVSTSSGETGEPAVTASMNGVAIGDRKAQEVLKKIQSSPTAVFHDSTDPDASGFLTRRAGSPGELGKAERDELEKAKGRLNRSLAKVAKRQQKEMGELLGRLKEKYKIGLSISEFDPDNFPYKFTLEDGGTNIPIENWGSGTQNQTFILMALFRAKRISEVESSPSKITPVIVIEEPESFLHPSAQGEFGHLIQSLAEEFRVQVIVTTHSQYMLSMTRPECNILLERHQVQRGKTRETRIVDTAGERWMEPFALALGVDNEHFKPWRSALFSDADSILLVEGETDQAYLELLQDEGHGEARLKFRGFIYPYGGRDQIRNRALIGLLKCRYKRFFITYDLDADKELSKLFEESGLQRGKQFLAIGQNVPGKDSIEGLLPDAVLSAVYGAHVDLVQQVQSSNREYRESARSRLKKLLLDEFKRVSRPGEEHYAKFYAVAKKVDAAMS